MAASVSAGRLWGISSKLKGTGVSLRFGSWSPVQGTCRTPNARAVATAWVRLLTPSLP
jgi:hypothetical protein